MDKKITHYTLKQYNEAMELKTQGYGSQRIAKILGLKNRNAVESWINQGRKPYYFSENRIAACNSQENIRRMREMNEKTQKKASLMGAELRRKKLPAKAKELTEELGYILGVIHGDGHVSVAQRRVILGATDKDFVLTFKDTLERWCGFRGRWIEKEPKASPYIKKRKKQYITYIDSIEASKFLKSFDLVQLEKAADPVLCSFLKGFFDSEGHVAKKRAIRGFNTNFVLIIFIKKILAYLKIYSTITSNKIKRIGHYASKEWIYHVNMYRKESIIKFYQLIGFNIQRKQGRLLTHVRSITNE